MDDGECAASVFYGYEIITGFSPGRLLRNADADSVAVVQDRVRDRQLQSSAVALYSFCHYGFNTVHISS